MAITWRTEKVTVVGFCGLPISAAAAMVAPVFESPPGQYFVGDPDAAAPPRTLMTREELEQQRLAGYLTLTSRHWERLQGGVVLYAHPMFLNPGENYSKLVPSELIMDRSADVHLDYISRPRALMILHRWGRLLIEDANRLLSGRPRPKEVERAINAAERALFCAPPPEHKTLRVEAFTSLTASYLVRRRAVERLYREMQIDFDDVTIAVIRQRAEAKAAGSCAYPVHDSNPRPDPADGHRISLVISRIA